jgi:hypothetical protein
MEDAISSTWKHIADRWTREDYVEDARRWKEFKKMLKEHSENDCKPEISCAGCNQGYCKHMSYYRARELGVCAMCDEKHQPRIANPRNRIHVERYLPKEAQDAISFPIERVFITGDLVRCKGCKIITNVLPEEILTKYETVTVYPNCRPEYETRQSKRCFVCPNCRRDCECTVLLG